MGLPMSPTSLPSQSPHVSDEALVLLADVMAVLASTDNGRHHLLHGQDQSRWTHNKYAISLDQEPTKSQLMSSAGQ